MGERATERWSEGEMPKGGISGFLTENKKEI